MLKVGMQRNVQGVYNDKELSTRSYIKSKTWWNQHNQCVYAWNIGILKYYRTLW